MFNTLLAKLAGKYLASTMKLQEGPPMPSKPWYQSKTIWTDIVTIVLMIVGLVDKYFTGGHIVTSPVYSIIVSLLASAGIYTRSNANTTIQ